MILVEGILVDPEKINTIMEWWVPRNVANTRSFMGLAGYFCHFIGGFSRIVFPITSLQRNQQTFEWTNYFQNRFEQLKQLLTTTLLLRIASPNQEFEVCTDACQE